MNFLLNKESEIVIYGAGPMAISWMERAVCTGFHVKIFIDKNADNIKYVEGVPVVTYEAYHDVADANDTVIIMLQNVMWHKEIAIQFQKLGIRKIIYFPMQFKGKHKERAYRLQRKYNECIKFDFGEFLEIPVLDNIHTYDEHEEGGHIRKDEKEIVVWAPAELCYSIHQKTEESIWKSDYTEETEKLIAKFICDRSLPALYPYWELFSFLDGEIDSCPVYLKIFGKEGHLNNQKRDDGSLLKDRNRLVEIFKDEICRGNEFFEQAPADSGIGSRGKIIIYDGMHRSVFLIRNEYWWIPVRLSIADYNYLFNAEATYKLKSYMSSNGIDELEYPVEMFGFYDYPIKYQYVRMIWKELTREIANREWILETALDLSFTDAYFSRAFYREGAEKIYCMIESGNVIPFIIRDIFRVSNIDFVHDVNYLYEIVNRCEIIIAHAGKLADLFPCGVSQWGDSLKGVFVYDLLIEEAKPVLKRVFGSGRECNLVKKYVVDGVMRGLYVIE